MNSGYEKKLSVADRLADQWAAVKMPVFAFLIGAVVGPLFSNYMGWQVTHSRAERESHESAVNQQAMICAFNARSENDKAATLGWSERRALADKYAVMPGRDAADSGVASACSDLLAKPV